MTKLQLAAFNKRSYSIYRGQREKLNEVIHGKTFRDDIASGKKKNVKIEELPFELGIFRVEMDKSLGKSCPYCTEKMTLSKIGLDHRIPITRAVEFKVSLQTMTNDDVEMMFDAEVKKLTFSFYNLEFVCQKCNRRKGDLTHVEYKQLVDFLSLLPTVASRYVMTKLGAKLPFFKTYVKKADRKAVIA